MFDPKISRNHPFLSGQNFRNLRIFVRNRPWPLLPVGPICPNTDPTRRCLCWPGICHFMVTHKSPNSSKNFFCSAKGPCPNVDLTSMSWRASLSEPGSNLHHPNWLFCPTSGTKMFQICPILPQTFMGIIRGPPIVPSATQMGQVRI